MKTDSNKKSWLALIFMGFAFSIVMLDTTAVSIALPQIGSAFSLSHNMLHWVVNAYLLSLACAIILGGRLNDFFNSKLVFLTGVVFFAASSLVCAVADSGGMLLLGRVLQGLAAAMIIPTSGVILFQLFPAHLVGRANGVRISLSSVCIALGPVLGVMTS